LKNTSICLVGLRIRIEQQNINFALVDFVVMVVTVVVDVVAVIEAAAVTSAEHTLVNSFGVDGLKIVSPTNASHQINEDHGQIDLPAQLASPVIVGKGVVVVVPSLANSAPGDKSVFRWTDTLVIRPQANHVSGRVDQPGHVQSPGVAEKTKGVVGNPARFTPHNSGQIRGQNKANEKNKRNIKLLLESKNWISLQVFNAQLLALLLDILMLAHEEPAHVGEEKSTSGFVRIGIGFAVLVMDSVITRPFDDMILKGESVENDQKNLKG